MSGWSLSDGRCCRGEDKRKQQVMRMHWQAFWHYKDFAHEQLLWLPEVIMNIAVFIPVGLALGLAFRKAKGCRKDVKKASRNFDFDCGSC